ncbi:MAG: HEAT repeat domain-containing protein [Oculatellaceae cyanobacterium bins.114]|nr:HEAT repeat domain-containing protein [Oculatellaceae cyanobacterium bins.114]
MDSTLHGAVAQSLSSQLTQLFPYSLSLVKPLKPQSLLNQVQSAIAQTDWAQAIECLQDGLLRQPSFATAQAADEFWDQALRLALTVLDLGDFQSRWDVAKLLPELGDRAMRSTALNGVIAPLITRLQDEAAELEVRWFAAQGLGHFPQAVVLQALVQTLQTCQNDELSGIIAVTLANFATEAVQNGSLTELMAVLTDVFVKPDTRRWVVQILSQVRHAETMPLLLQAAHDPQVEVRAIAIDALTNFHHPRVTDVFVQALGDPVATVRTAALTGLGLQADRLAHLDLVSMIKPLLGDLNGQVCEQAAIALGRLGTDAAVNALAETLRSPYTPEPLQMTILQTLGWMESSQAIEAVQHFLLHQGIEPKTEVVIQTSLHALTQVKTPPLRHQVAQFLIDLLHSDHSVTQAENTRKLLAIGLGQLGEPTALEPLIQLLADPDMGVQLHAIAALKHLDSQTAHYRLMELAQTQNLRADLSRGLAIALQEW